mmetsp:Transcript_62479/g.123484  ORF Transcript_62479/g.123484 Transcript_62479/m.123484 type:complete len:115 (-) Transcript_62479:155-499(-)
MASSRAGAQFLVVVACFALLQWSAAPSFLAPKPKAAATDLEAALRVASLVTAGSLPLATERPAAAYDSVVSMLQSWLIGGSLMLIIFAAVLVAATANPLTKRRAEILSQVENER